MERQNKLLTVLMIVLLCMLVPVLLKKGKGKDETPSDPDAPASHALFEYDQKDITGVTLTSAKGTVRFEKQETTWKMVEPKELAVEARKVDEIVERFRSVKVEERGLTGPATDYGLEDAQAAHVTLSKADGSTMTVIVGIDSPVGWKSYVKVDESSPPVLASTRLHDLAARGMDDFRSKDIWKVNAYDTRRIRIEREGRAVVLRKEGENWWVGDNGPRADSDAIQKWLSAASTLKADSFLDGTDPSTVGLLNPTAIINIESGDGAISLKVGTLDESGAVVQTPTGGLVRVGTAIRDILKVEGWESNKLSSAARYLIEGIDLQLGAQKWHYARQEGAWADANNKAVVMDAFMDKLLAIEVDRSNTALPTLSESWGRLSLSLGEEGGRESFVIGQLEGTHRLIRDEAGGPIFTVEQTELDALAKTLP